MANAARRKRTRQQAVTTAAATARRAIGRTVASVVARVAPPAHDAVALLERDHRRIEDLVARGEKTTARATTRRRELLQTLTDELAAHEKIEEQIFYPALKRHSKARELVLEGYQEHHVADILVRELHALPPTDERWGAKFKVLKENLEHHIEEEEGEMFKTARSVLSPAQIQALGQRMAALKERNGHR